MENGDTCQRIFLSLLELGFRTDFKIQLQENSLALVEREQVKENGLNERKILLLRDGYRYRRRCGRLSCLMSMTKFFRFITNQFLL